ncbi:MAG: Na+/H+ antiporter subunit E, partial [Rhizobiales bacterium]|nr:Na+/H+ antiporter subunit E [Hyphomicrobiales bacterium]
MRVASLAIALYAFWLLLSGHYSPFLLGAGAVAAVAIAFAGRSFGYADKEGHPVELILAGLRYWPWLLVEIAKSSLEVSRVIVSPSLPISPRSARVKAGPDSAVGMATYANSITLTPGTITIDADRHHHWVKVHALTSDGIAALEA